MKKEIPANHLIILPKQNYVLDHFLVDWIDENNIEILKKGILEGIIFVDDRDDLDQFDIKLFATIGNESDEKLLAQMQNFIIPFGKSPGLKVYQYSGKIFSLSPQKPDPDFEKKLFEKKGLIFILRSTHVSRGAHLRPL